MVSAKAESLKRAILGLGLGGNREIKVSQVNRHDKHTTRRTRRAGYRLYGSELAVRLMLSRNPSFHRH
jgi:hypothetical protein